MSSPQHAIPPALTPLQQAVVTAYPVAAGHNDNIKALTDDVLRCLQDNSAGLAPLVDDWNKFMQLVSYIRSDWGGGGAYADRASVLIDYNQLLNQNVRRPNINADQFNNLRGLLTEMARVSAAELNSLRTVFTSSGLNYLIERYVTGTNKANVLKMIAACQRTQGQLGLIAVNRLAELEAIYQNNPPQGFEGFAAWGDGNKGNPEDNITEHCMKHMFYEFPESETAPPLEEIKMWWDAFKVKVTLADVLPHVVPKHLAAGLDGDLQRLFGADYAVRQAAISFDPARRTHLEMLAYLLKTYPNLSNQLLTKYQPLYASYTLKESRTMGNTQVHLSQNEYFISGTAGSLFIIGRIENGVASISSAYWVPDPTAKVAAAAQERLWELSSA